jgi:DNA-binding beta-propeller fold protein YncE
MIGTLFQLFATTALSLMIAAVAPAGAQEVPRNAPMDFKGHALISISDADMLASAYVDGQLGPREGHDVISVIPLVDGVRDIDIRSLRAYETEVSNSVAGAPSAVATSPDGRYAFVVETFQQADPEAQRFSDLSPGTRLTLVDIANPKTPRVLERIEVGKRLETVEINPDGNMLAVGLHPLDGRGVAFIPFHDGRLGKPNYHLLPGVDKDTRITHVSWHPSGRFISAALSDVGRIVFSKVQQQGDEVSLKPWGGPVLVGKYPFKSIWTPDGKYLLTNNLQWGPDVSGFWTDAPRGSVASVRFADQTTTDAQGSKSAQHVLTSVAETGVSPEGLTISPDGQLVVTTNLERSFLPYGDRRATWHASLSLLSFDAASGQLRHLVDYPYDGILPEAAVFDNSSRYLAVANFDHFDDTRPGGSIDFWRVDRDPLNPHPLLVRTAHNVAVTRGPHSIVLAR